METEKERPKRKATETLIKLSDNSDGDIKKGAASALNPHPFGFPYLLVTDDKETPKEKIRDILDE